MHVSEKVDGFHVRITMRSPAPLDPLKQMRGMYFRYVLLLHYDDINIQSSTQAISRRNPARDDLDQIPDRLCMDGP
jgi:hypothetical protein